MYSLRQTALGALLFTGAALAALSAQAADNFVVKDAGGATITMRSKDTGTAQIPFNIPTDVTGVAYSGSNPFTIAGTVSLTGSLPTLAAGSATIGSILNISGTISLPTGAATSAKQPSLGTAGSPSTDVLSIQGVVGGVAQPVSLASLPTLAAGSAIVGKFGIDQTTAGTTNGVVVNSSALPTGGSTSALQTTGNGLLTTANTALGTLNTTSGSVIGSTTTQTKSAVVTTNTFITALASSSGRKGCTLQYIGSLGHTGFIYFGSTGPSDTTTSFQLVPGQSLSCSAAGRVVAQDNIYVTGTAADVFIVSAQQ